MAGGAYGIGAGGGFGAASAYGAQNPYPGTQPGGYSNGALGGAARPRVRPVAPGGGGATGGFAGLAAARVNPGLGGLKAPPAPATGPAASVYPEHQAALDALTARSTAPATGPAAAPRTASSNVPYGGGTLQTADNGLFNVPTPNHGKGLGALPIGKFGFQQDAGFLQYLQSLLGPDFAQEQSLTNPTSLAAADAPVYQAINSQYDAAAGDLARQQQASGIADSSGASMGQAQIGADRANALAGENASIQEQAQTNLRDLVNQALQARTAADAGLRQGSQARALYNLQQQELQAQGDPLGSILGALGGLGGSILGGPIGARLFGAGGGGGGGLDIASLLNIIDSGQNYLNG